MTTSDSGTIEAEEPDDPSPVQGAGNIDEMQEGEVTLMLRNISRKLSQEDVKQTLDAVGLKGYFAFVYAPLIVVRGSNAGYAFVRFRSGLAASACFQLCHGRPFGSTSSKPCRVALATVQDGVEGILAKSRRKHGGQKPDILICGDEPVAELPTLPGRTAQQREGSASPSTGDIPLPRFGLAASSRDDLSARLGAARVSEPPPPGEGRGDWRTAGAYVARAEVGAEGVFDSDDD